jgi:hypothetical protein
MDDQDRQDYYRAFDRAVKLVRADLKPKIELLTSSLDFDDNSVSLRDKRCKLLATVAPDGTVTYPVRGGIAATTKSAVPTSPSGISQQTLNETVKRVLRAVTRRIVKSDEALLEVTEILRNRICALEASTVNKSLDVEAFDSLAEVVERVEKIESRIADIGDRGFKYRGYWTEGMKAKKTEAFTHNGSLWLAMYDTDDAPDQTSVDWKLIVRRGRDGKDAR